MTRDALSRMDVDTHWVTHRRWKSLQRLYPEDWPDCAVAYFALLGDSWSARNRLTLADAWPAALRADYNLVAERLTEAGLIDKTGKVPKDSWDEWYGPAARRIESGRNAAAIRWARESHSNGNAYSQPAKPAKPENARRRGGATVKTAPVSMKDAMQAAGFDPDNIKAPHKGEGG